jgi:hypothetical protein
VEHRKVSEVEIEREGDSILGQSLREDLIVGRSLQPLLAQMDGIVTMTAQPLDDAPIHAHVGEESHASRLARADFLARQPGRILKRPLKVRSLEVGIPRKDLLNGGAVRDLRDNHRHRDAHPPDTSATAHDFRIEGDVLKHVRPLLSHLTSLI